MKEELKEHWWMYLLMLVIFFGIHLYLYRDTDDRWFYWLVMPLIISAGTIIGPLWGASYRRKNKNFRESIEREYKNFKK